ncbi:MAG TPA: hypothetical protein VF712_04265 [Thermoleophilaceae bacterium]|jgi:hypothetical protein
MAGAEEDARRSLRDWLASPAGAVAAAVATIVIVGIVALGSGEDGGPGGSGAQQAVNPPAPVSAEELASLSESLDQPVYWAGPQGGSKQYDLTRQGADRIVIRYPAPGGGSPSQGTLTVGTYRLDDAQGAIRRAAEVETATLHRLPKRGLAVSDTARPTNVYLAYPREPFQVEVFDPQPGRALELVLGRKIRPVR